MPTFAVGDLQGCLTEFELLLKQMNFGASDKLWLVGDLVNRGPRSRETMDMILSMADQIECVLGNHDLHFLAIHSGGHSPSGSDTFDEMLASPNVDAYADWLRKQKLFHVDKQLGFAMSHAGLPHIWTIKRAERLANEVEAVLRGDADVPFLQFCKELYGNEPNEWSDDIEGMPRYRLITNYLTRMRLVNGDGALDFEQKGALGDVPVGWKPWFAYPNALKYEKVPMRLIFGHWAALDGYTGRSDLFALDTGCVWGRTMSGLCLETQETYAVKAAKPYS